MPTYRDEGIVLRTHNLGEADRIVTFLTRTHGKVRAVAKGVRRTSSKFGGRLEPFSHVDVQFAMGKNLDVVSQVEQLHAYGEPLMRRYGAFTVGQVMLETADRMSPMEKEPVLSQYRLLCGALRTLGEGTSDGERAPSMILDAYLLRSLAISGYAPSLSECAICGLEGPHQAFNPASGGVVCVNCRPPGSAHPRTETIALLTALLTGDWEQTRDVDSMVLREADGLTVAFTNWHLEHRLRSLPLVDRSRDETDCY
ncbi:MAG: DNA repair protein RecO [Propionibacteriaceae bacterium]